MRRAALGFSRLTARWIVFDILLILALLDIVSLPVLSRIRGRAYSRQTIVESLDTPVAVERTAAGKTDAPEWVLDYVLHPFLGYVRNRDAKAHVFNDRPIDIPVNEYGFFGPAPPFDRSPGRVTVVLTGGSAALDLYFRCAAVLSDLLAEAPPFEGKKVEIVSLALGGMKEPQQLMALSWFLSLGAAIDIVINLDGFNEIALPFAENVPFGVAASFPRSWRSYAAKGFDPKTTTLFGEIESRRAKVERWRRRISANSIVRRSGIVLALWRAWSDGETARIAAAEVEIRERFRDDRAVSFQESGPPPGDPSPADLFRSSADLWKRSSEQIANLCRANDIAYFHFLQPNQYVSGSKKLTDWEKRHAVAAPTYPHVRAVREAYPLLQAAGKELRSEGVAFFDLTPLFSSEKETIYEDQCCHYN